MQQLVTREMRAGDCDYPTAFERVSKANPELLGAMHRSAANQPKREPGSIKRTDLDAYPKGAAAGPRVEALRKAASGNPTPIANGARDFANAV